MAGNTDESFESRIDKLQDRLTKLENNIEQQMTEKKSINPELELIERRLKKLCVKLDDKK